jgi:hypothetical protein
MPDRGFPGSGSHQHLISRSHIAAMSYAAKASLSIVVGIAAAVAVVALGNTPADAIGCTIVAAALLVFMRALMSLASDSGEPPLPSDTRRKRGDGRSGARGLRRRPDSYWSHQGGRVSLHDFDQGETDAHRTPRDHRDQR